MGQGESRPRPEISATVLHRCISPRPSVLVLRTISRENRGFETRKNAHRKPHRKRTQPATARARFLNRGQRRMKNMNRCTSEQSHLLRWVPWTEERSEEEEPPKPESPSQPVFPFRRSQKSAFTPMPSGNEGIRRSNSVVFCAPSKFGTRWFETFRRRSFEKVRKIFLN